MISGIISDGSALVLEAVDESKSEGDRSDKHTDPQKAPMSESEIDDIVKEAEEEKINYLSPRIDKVWRHIHTSTNDDVIKALVATHLSVAFPGASINYKSQKTRKCRVLNTTSDLSCTVECDSCFSIAPGALGSEDLITFPKKPTGKGNGKKAKPNAAQGLEQEQELRMADQINKRGVLLFAEMQQAKVSNQIKGVDERLPIVEDTIRDRLGTYAAGLHFRDGGEPLKSNGDDPRSGKLIGDKTPRPIVGVAYLGYDTDDWRDVHIPNGTISGTVLATKSIGEAENFLKSEADDIGKEVKKIKTDISLSHPSATQDIQKLVSEVITVVIMGPLLSLAIVKGFSKEMQTMCEMLAITKNNVEKAKLSQLDFGPLPEMLKLKKELAAQRKRAEALEQENVKLRKQFEEAEAKEGKKPKKKEGSLFRGSRQKGK